LTSKLLTTYKQQIADLKLIPSGGGCFELTADGELLYSKLKTKEFPKEDEMIKAIGNKLKSAKGAKAAAH
jgi:selenoprotein W-related protein